MAWSPGCLALIAANQGEPPIRARRRRDKAICHINHYAPPPRPYRSCPVVNESGYKMKALSGLSEHLPIRSFFEEWRLQPEPFRLKPPLR